MTHGNGGADGVLDTARTSGAAPVAPWDTRARAVIFDLDGVLLDTEPLYTLATQRVLDPYGLTFTPELKREVMGLAASESAAKLAKRLALALAPERFLALREAHLAELLTTCSALAGAAEWVAALTGAGIAVALATSSQRALCELKWLDHPFIAEMSPKLCGDDPGIARAKPAPDIYLKAASLLGEAPASCLVFEDSPAGVLAGLAAGMQVVHVASPYVSAEQIPFAHHRIASLSEATLPRFGLTPEALDVAVRR